MPEIQESHPHPFKITTGCPALELSMRMCLHVCPHTFTHSFIPVPADDSAFALLDVKVELTFKSFQTDSSEKYGATILEVRHACFIVKN